ncbi:uncharacterized protein [Hemitrygon akajei]|uniref:uncharacterized protein n=1 Tax=Hemitrygon akajei TaxID=2704970 RepID=UPI003BF9E847
MPSVEEGVDDWFESEIVKECALSPTPPTARHARSRGARSPRARGLTLRPFGTLRARQVTCELCSSIDARKCQFVHHFRLNTPRRLSCIVQLHCRSPGKSDCGFPGPHRTPSGYRIRCRKTNEMGAIHACTKTQPEGLPDAESDHATASSVSEERHFLDPDLLQGDLHTGPSPREEIAFDKNVSEPSSSFEHGADSKASEMGGIYACIKTQTDGLSDADGDHVTKSSESEQIYLPDPDLFQGDPHTGTTSQEKIYFDRNISEQSGSFEHGAGRKTNEMGAIHACIKTQPEGLPDAESDHATASSVSEERHFLDPDLLQGDPHTGPSPREEVAFDKNVSEPSSSFEHGAEIMNLNTPGCEIVEGASEKGVLVPSTLGEHAVSDSVITELLASWNDFQLLQLTDFYRDRLEQAIEGGVHGVSLALTAENQFSGEEHRKISDLADKGERAESSKLLLSLVMEKGSRARRVMWGTFVKMRIDVSKFDKILEEIQEHGCSHSHRSNPAQGLFGALCELQVHHSNGRDCSSLGGNDLGDSGVKPVSAALRNPTCKIQKLGLFNVGLTDSGAEDLASALSSKPSVTELDLSYNKLGDSGVKQLSAALTISGCKIRKLKLIEVGLTASGAEDLATALITNPLLTELSLSDNKLEDSGVKLVSAALSISGCKIQKLWLHNVELTDSGAEDLVSILSTNPSLTKLDLSINKLGDSGVKLVSDALRKTECKIQKLELAMVDLTDSGAEDLVSALSTNPSLMELDLSRNKLGDSGVKVLSAALRNTECKIQKLWLAMVGLTDSGAEDLASALSTKPSLTKLDLSYNKLGDSGVKQLSAALRNPECKIRKLKLAMVDLTDSGAEDLVSVLSTNTSLTELDLSRNKLGDSGVKKLSAALRNTECKIQKLWLAMVDLTDSGARNLASALNTNPSLTELELRSNLLTDRSVSVLCRLVLTLPSLERIGLWGNWFGGTGKKELRSLQESRSGLRVDL